MGIMADVAKTAEKTGIRGKAKTMIGGAPSTDEFARQIGADAYTPDATTAAELAAGFCEKN